MKFDIKLPVWFHLAMKQAVIIFAMSLTLLCGGCVTIEKFEVPINLFPVSKDVPPHSEPVVLDE